MQTVLEELKVVRQIFKLQSATLTVAKNEIKELKVSHKFFEKIMLEIFGSVGYIQEKVDSQTSTFANPGLHKVVNI